MSRSSNHFKLVPWTWQWVHCTKINKSPDINPIEHLWDVVELDLHALDVHPTNLHQLQDAILSIWANISKEMVVSENPSTWEDCEILRPAHLAPTNMPRSKLLNLPFFPILTFNLEFRRLSWTGGPNNPLGECIYFCFLFWSCTSK